MNESTLQGDSVDITNVDTAAQALLARREQQAPVVSDETTDNEPTEEQATDEEAEQPEITGETDESDAPDEDEETRFETLRDLAEATGMDQDEFLKSIKATVKVQGDQSEVNLSDLIKGYQLQSDYTRKNEAFLNQKKEWEANQAKAQAELNAELQKAGHAFKIAQDQLTHEFHAINWDQLQKDDPQDYLIKRQQFGERQAQIDTAINEATQNAQAVMQQQQQQREAKRSEYLQKENDLLLQAIPEWKEAEARAKGVEKVAVYLTNNGFSTEEVATIGDHRIVLMAHKAMNNDRMAKDTDVALKKVKKAPKLVKPNARQSPDQGRKTRINKLKTKAFQTGRAEDIAAALLAKRSK